jgi:hypothetical protein
MNRTLTAAVALAAAFGIAGLASAQSTTPTTTQTPGMTAPAPMSPGMTPSSNGAYQPATPGNGQQALQGQQGTMQNGQQTSPAGIQQAQQRLRSQGLYNGAIDGRLGPEMKTALMQFQQRNGLPQTGTLDQQTSARLTQSNNNLGPTPTNGSAMPGATNPPTTINR